MNNKNPHYDLQGCNSNVILSIYNSLGDECPNWLNRGLIASYYVSLEQADKQNCIQWITERYQEFFTLTHEERQLYLDLLNNFIYIQKNEQQIKITHDSQNDLASLKEFFDEKEWGQFETWLTYGNTRFVAYQLDKGLEMC